MRKIATVLAFVSMFSLCGCMGLVPLGEAVDDMVVDFIPGDAKPEFNFPFVGDLHDPGLSFMDVFLPWTWFNGWTFESEAE